MKDLSSTLLVVIFVFSTLYKCFPLHFTGPTLEVYKKREVYYMHNKDQQSCWSMDGPNSKNIVSTRLGWVIGLFKAVFVKDMGRRTARFHINCLVCAIFHSLESV